MLWPGGARFHRRFTPPPLRSEGTNRTTINHSKVGPIFAGTVGPRFVDRSKSPIDPHFIASATLRLSLLGCSEALLTLAHALRRPPSRDHFDTCLTAYDRVLMRSINIELNT